MTNSHKSEAYYDKQLELTRERFKKQFKAIQDNKNKLIQQKKTAAVKRLKTDIEKYGIKPDDLFGTSYKCTPVVKKKVEAKYQDPMTGKMWSGRGKEPLWIKGKDRSLFSI